MIRSLCCVALLTLSAAAAAEAPIVPAVDAPPPVAVDPKRAELDRLPFNKATVGEIIQKNLPDIQKCYEDAMALRGQTGSNAPGGKVAVAWTITVEGLVSDAKVKRSAMKDAMVTDCIELAVRAWEFPKPQQATPLEVPFELKPFSGAAKPAADKGTPVEKKK